MPGPISSSYKGPKNGSPLVPSWMNDKPMQTAHCLHEWQEVDSQFSNENSTDVRCKLCGVHGERDEKTGNVFWPAT